MDELFHGQSPRFEPHRLDIVTPDGPIVAIKALRGWHATVEEKVADGDEDEGCVRVADHGLQCVSHALRGTRRQLQACVGTRSRRGVLSHCPVVHVRTEVRDQRSPRCLEFGGEGLDEAPRAAADMGAQCSDQDWDNTVNADCW